MNSSSLRRFSALLLLAAALGACSPHPGALCTQAACLPTGAAPSRGATPNALVGTWFAGAGGTTVSVDPSTGVVGDSNAAGVTFAFGADGTYTKAFRGHSSAGGCGTTLHAYEVGTVAWEGETFTLQPASGTSWSENNCSPSLNQTHQLSAEQLDRGSYAWGFDGDALLLQDAQGALASYRRQ